MRIKMKYLSMMLVTAFLLWSKSSIAQDLVFERVFDETLAQASYMIGDKETNEALVIDPKRDIDTYLKLADSVGLKIKYVAETHIHADFLSGAQELAVATGAELLLSAEGGDEWQYQFPHTPLKEGSIVTVGKLAIKIMHTPGHTPESLTMLLMDPKTNTPQKAITGDFIFVGDVGRPDLLEQAAGQVGTMETSAKQLYASIQRFLKLPDELEIWPGHGAGSFCGKSLSNIPQSTLKVERMTNPALQFPDDESGFVSYILEGQPQPPKYFAVMKYLNRVKRPLAIEIPKHPQISEEAFHKAKKNGLTIIDTRGLELLAKGSVDGSLHINGGKSFSTWMGSLVDYDAQLILIAEKGAEEDLTRKLMRIGMDNIYGFVTDVREWNAELKKPVLVDIETFKANLGNKDVQLIDVRTNKEYKEGHIKGVENHVLTSLSENLDKVSTDKPVILHCQSGVRAAMARSILEKNGFDNIKTFSGGMNEWLEKENKVISNK